jgi:hypothetical protein
MEESSSTAAMPPQSGATPELSATVANSSIDAQQEPQIKSAMSRNLVVFALGLAILVGILDATIVATLVPSIADDFSSVGSASWYGSA